LGEIIMELPLSVTFRDMESSAAIEDDVAHQVDKLERRFGRIMSCRVVIEAPHKHRHKGRMYQVSVDLKVPGREIAANSTGPKDHAHEDMHVAIRDAFAAVERRLQDHARKSQGAVKAKDVPMHGRIAKLIAEEDYGFIRTSDGREVYFHKNAVVDGAFEKLKTDQEVRLVIAEGEGEKGPQASTVKPIGKHHLAGPA
jgi:ribosomal subunit interface protein